MSQDRLQEVYNDLRTMKQERKKLKDALKDELKHHERYGEVSEELTALRTEKKAIETQVRQAAPQDIQRIEELDIEIKASEELLSDLAFNLLVANESVEVKDEQENRYVPQFLVRFKKSEEGVKEA